MSPLGMAVWQAVANPLACFFATACLQAIGFLLAIKPVLNCRAILRRCFREPDLSQPSTHSDAETAPRLVLEQLSCERDDRLLFSGLSLTASAGEIWQITGATRAAARHQTETGDPMPVWLTYGAVLAGLGSGGAGVLTSLLGVPVPPAYVPPETGVTRQGPDLMLEGPITFAMLKGVKANLSGPAPPMSLVLNSDGGMVVAARAIATEVLKTGMDTQVTGRCASACTLIFLAGRERHLTPGGQIGFHSYRLKHPNPVIDAESELAKDRHYLATRGVTADFLDQAFSRSGSENMWFPDHQTLLHGGVVTR